MTKVQIAAVWTRKASAGLVGSSSQEETKTGDTRRKGPGWEVVVWPTKKWKEWKPSSRVKWDGSLSPESPGLVQGCSHSAPGLPMAVRAGVRRQMPAGKQASTKKWRKQEPEKERKIPHSHFSNPGVKNCTCFYNVLSIFIHSVQFSHSVMSDSVTPGTAAHQASLSSTISQSLLNSSSLS